MKKFEKSRRNFIYHTLNIANIVVTIFFNIDDNALITSFKSNVIVFDEIFRVIKFNMKNVFDNYNVRIIFMIENENQFRSVVFFNNFENSFDKFIRLSFF